VTLVARGLSHSYGGVRVLDALSVSVDAGQIVGVLGPNGAGKTTALKIIAGEIQPRGGTVFLGDRPLDGLRTHQRTRLGLGYLPQQPSIFRDCTVVQNMEMAVEGLKGSAQQIDVLLESCGIAHLASARAVTLSGGERRRLELARSLVGQPSALVLDEPFSGIDPVGIETLQTVFLGLAADGLAILMTDHAVQATLSMCDRAVILESGTVMAEGCPEDVAADTRVRDRYLGGTFRLEKLTKNGHIER